MSIVVLEARQIVKRFPGALALAGVDFLLHRGEMRALVGENGAGKSTLIKIFTGVYKKDTGTLLLNGNEVTHLDHALRQKIAFVPQELNLFKHLTVAENIFIPLNESKHERQGGQILSMKKLCREAEQVLARLNVKIDPRMPIRYLGPAELQMVQIARAIVHQFEILILDEPTSSISFHEAESLFRILRDLKAQGKSIIYITHKLEEVFQLADSVTVLRDGHLIATRPIAELNYDAIVHMMAGELLSDFTLEKDRDVTRAKVLLEVEGLSGTGFQNVNFQLHHGEIIGFAGLVGAKRTEIMETIFGFLPKKSGRVLIEGKEVRIKDPADSFRLGLIYMPEDRKQLGLFIKLSLGENVTMPLLKRLSVIGMISGSRKNQMVESLIRRFNIKASSPHQRMGFLSGGNQQKAILARSISVDPKIVIFDEPTVGIDVKAKADIYKHLHELTKMGLGLIVVSSDIKELLKVADRIMVVHSGRIQGEFRGDSSCQEEILSAALGLANSPQKN